MVGSIVERVFGRIGNTSSAVVPFGAPAPLSAPASPSSSLEAAEKEKDSTSSESDFDYCCTLSDSYDMPINFGIQFVAPGKTRRAAEFLRGVCSIYDFSSTFVAGQEVKREFFCFFLFFFILSRSLL